MDNVDIENIQTSIKEIQESHKKAVNDEGSEDKVDELTRELGEVLGNMVYVAEGPDEFSLDRDELKQLKALGEIGGDRNNPSLLIPNPVNKHQPLEVKIIPPGEQ